MQSTNCPSVVFFWRNVPQKLRLCSMSSFAKRPCASAVISHVCNIIVWTQSVTWKAELHDVTALPCLHKAQPSRAIRENASSVRPIFRGKGYYLHNLDFLYSLWNHGTWFSWFLGFANVQIIIVILIILLLNVIKEMHIFRRFCLLVYSNIAKLLHSWATRMTRWGELRLLKTNSREYIITFLFLKIWYNCDDQKGTSFMSLGEGVISLELITIFIMMATSILLVVQFEPFGLMIMY